MLPSRSPSPLPGGGWASPGLNNSSSSNNNISRGSSPALSSNSAPLSWQTAKTRSGHPIFSTHNQGFFTRHMRRISNNLPRFGPGPSLAMRQRPYATKPKGNGHGKFSGSDLPLGGRLTSILARINRKAKVGVLALLGFFFCLYLLWSSPFLYRWRRFSWGGGGEKYVIILGANMGGGVMTWKGPREWAVERDSIRNKREYAWRWGYELEVVDLSTKKKYAHEWRESWEKVDSIRNVMKKYPSAEWFWWLDLNTYIMEPTLSLQGHLFQRLGSITYRDINLNNPLKMEHPPTQMYLDEVSRSPNGDGDVSSMQLLLSQDCTGFSLGSFFIRRGEWADQLMDMWWDPVVYEQLHLEWAHKEQDALQQLYSSFPWVRNHIGFFPQRFMNSYPPGACGEKNENISDIHYHQEDRDFVVNMAGCEYGRDCWGEMYRYREHSKWLNRDNWQIFADKIPDAWKPWPEHGFEQKFTETVEEPDEAGDNRGA